MNIQMILSALPTQLSGKPESGAGQGHFALALSQAAHPLQAGDSTLPIPLDAMPGQGLPQTLAAPQALLQALNARPAQPLGDEAALAQLDTQLPQPDAQLSEIMARLALIEGSHQEPIDTDVPPLPIHELSIAADDKAPELAEQPQAAALVTAVAAEAQRPNVANPGMNVLGEERATRSDLPATPASLVSGTPLTAQLATAGTAAAPEADSSSGTSSRPADFTSAFAKVAAAQPGGLELRSVAADASRGGFVPESAPLAPPSASTAALANAPAQTTPFAQTSLAAPVQSPAWPSQLGQQLVQFARQGGERQVEMRLNPAELGPLSVTLKMTEQGAQAQFLSAHAQVRQVLEQAIPQLREALAEQGISLGETSVGEQHRQDTQAFAGHDGQRGQGAQPGAEDDLALSGADETGTEPSTAALSLDGRVNLYA
ncbi:flagellar hook-length control protein FliK [Billgrantia sp. Q4P2]|uniref:flagellar hook-length control protein FliK n=1 Tax=Billgrantia sp. Q4P2 TaxID=3463857 RepID=UPI004056F3D7